MPDATGLELLAADLGDAALETVFFRSRAPLVIHPARGREVLAALRAPGSSPLRGHHDLRRILMPEDYEGHPQRRDFPVGGEPVIFTRDERKWLEERD